MFFFGLVNFNWLEIYWGFFAVKREKKERKCSKGEKDMGDCTHSLLVGG